ncbi:MAG: hypothetical protein RIG67_34165, partial [Rhodospirillales bacterium]
MFGHWHCSVTGRLARSTAPASKQLRGFRGGGGGRVGGSLSSGSGGRFRGSGGSSLSSGLGGGFRGGLSRSLSGSLSSGIPRSLGGG